MLRTLVAAAALAACAAAAAPSKPWTSVEPADRSETRQEFPPAITQIDGQSTKNPLESQNLEPGPHKVTIRFETGRVTQGPGEVTRVVDIAGEACTRYRIAARRIGGTSWEPKVYPEKIGECARQFK